MRKRIPFTFHGKDCALNVEYTVNPGPEDSGFSILKNLPVDLNRCKGYPMLHLTVEAEKLRGYERLCAFVQILRCRDVTGGEEKESWQLDLMEETERAGLPYFAFGYPAELFDAPAMNLMGDRLDWQAYTFLVEMPNTRINDGKLGFLCGITWGYAEDASGVTEIREMKCLNREDWLRCAEKVSLKNI